MLTSYPAVRDLAIVGQPIGDVRDSRPMTLPWLAQITTVTTANGAVTDDWVITITDDESGQVYSVTAAGSATEATLDSNMEAAFAAHAKLPSLFTLGVTSVSDVVATFTARHPNRTYTFSATGGTGANTVANTQNAGGSGLEFGVMVARASTGDKEFRAVTSTDTLRNLCGILFRTDANHFHSLENDTPSAVDACARGRTYSIGEEMRVWVYCESNWTPESRVYCRLATTSSAGRVGAFRTAVAGSTQVLTLTAVADHQLYSVRVDMMIDGERRTLSFKYAPTDGTSTTDVAIDGLEPAAAAAIIAQGFTGLVTASAASAAATMTLTAAAGTQFLVPDGDAFGEDTAAEAVTFSLAAADVDTLDVTSICRFENSGSGSNTSPGLAELRIKI